MSRTFKTDKYRMARGGYSRLMDIHCRECGDKLFEYQKDGKGDLRRLYLDRIFPKYPTTKELTCPTCGEILGSLYVYEKENRKAYRLYQDAVVKKVKRLR